MGLGIIGSVNLNTAPFSPLLSAQILPLCTSIDFLHNASPTPLPPAGVRVFELTTKAPKISCNSKVGIPIPSSLILNSTVFLPLYKQIVMWLYYSGQYVKSKYIYE